MSTIDVIYYQSWARIESTLLKWSIACELFCGVVATERNFFLFKLDGRRQPSALFDLARTRFEILVPKYLYQVFLVNFLLVLISMHNHLLYPEKLVLLLISGIQGTSSLHTYNLATCPW